MRHPLEGRLGVLRVVKVSIRVSLVIRNTIFSSNRQYSCRSFETVFDLSLLRDVTLSLCRSFDTNCTYQQKLFLVSFLPHSFRPRVTLEIKCNFSHINLSTHSCYYQIRQLRVVSRSLSHNATLAQKCNVNAFVMTHE